MAAEPVRHYDLEEIASATGGFHALAAIGSGGFGTVYRAMLGATPAACKVADAGSLQGAAEFENELALLSRLRHPHLVRLLGVHGAGGGNGAERGGENAGGGSSSVQAAAEAAQAAAPSTTTTSTTAAAALVYELMPGGGVDQHLSYAAGRAPLPWCCRIRVAAQAAAALAYCHSHSLVHRDVKPANVLLGPSPLREAKLGDVGLAATATAAARVPGSSGAGGGGGAANGGPTGGGGGPVIAGEWPYLAPELRATGAYSAKTDVYAFGVSLLQLAAGAAEGLAGLAARARSLAQAGRARELLDRGAGVWDAFAGDAAIELALWCAADAPDARPAMAVAAGELARLAAAVGAAGGADGSCAACTHYCRGFFPSPNSNSGSGAVPQAGTTPPRSPQHRTGVGLFGGAPGGGGNNSNSFWRG